MLCNKLLAKSNKIEACQKVRGATFFDLQTSAVVFWQVQKLQIVYSELLGYVRIIMPMCQVSLDSFPAPSQTKMAC